MDVQAVMRRTLERADKYISSVRLPGKPTVEKRKKLEHIWVKRFDKILSEDLKRYYTKFPDLSALSPFHREIMEAYVDINDLRRNLARVKSVLKILASVRDEALYDIFRARSHGALRAAKRKYLGRVRDVLEKNVEVFQRISYAWYIYRKLPRIKDAPTVVLAGYPNVGKSSMLYALTGSRPEIADYPFTTKDIRVGFMECGLSEVQVLDTPGLLDRADKLNPVEKKAIAAMKHVARLVVFIIDPTQPLQPQRDLLTILKDMIGVRIIVVKGKTDLYPDNIPDAALNVSPVTGEGISELKTLICREMGVKT